MTSIFGCAYYPNIPKSIENSFTYCYAGKNTGLDTLINIDGYYREMSFNKRSPTVGGFLKDTSIYYIDTSYHYFMFYEDGIFVYNIRDSYYDVNKKELVKKDVSLFMKDFIENTENSARQFYSNFWGGYIICGDTIRMQSMYKGMSLNSGWHLGEVWYKIIDKNTILCINSFNLPEMSRPKERTHYPVVFFPIPEKPKSDRSWILREKWFWCNEEDWRVFSDNLEKNK